MQLSVGDTAVPIALLPELLEPIDRELRRLDPGACTDLDLTCPACQHTWIEPFDIGAYFWTELSAYAERLLHEIHVLARAYGWTEGDVLGLSRGRRRRYLELVTR